MNLRKFLYCRHVDLMTIFLCYPQTPLINYLLKRFLTLRERRGRRRWREVREREREGEGVCAAVVCVWLFASSCLHIYIFQNNISHSLTCSFFLFQKYRRNQLFSESHEMDQISLVIRLYYSIKFAINSLEAHSLYCSQIS